METIEMNTKLVGLLVSPAPIDGTGLSFGSDAAFGDVPSGNARPWTQHDERPTKASVAAVAKNQGYAYAATGAGAATLMRAFRGPEPWGKRT